MWGLGNIGAYPDRPGEQGHGCIFSRRFLVGPLEIRTWARGIGGDKPKPYKLRVPLIDPVNDVIMVLLIVILTIMCIWLVNYNEVHCFDHGGRVIPGRFFPLCA